jgi:uncharacterized cupin superfamily protein
MPTSTAPAVPCPDVHRAALLPSGSMPGAALGMGTTRSLTLYFDGRTSTGIREIDQGTFRSAQGPYLEFLHVIAGEATIIADDGETHEVGPGSALTLRAGWTGRWTVYETLRVTVVRVFDGA